MILGSCAIAALTFTSCSSEDDGLNIEELAVLEEFEEGDGMKSGVYGFDESSEPQDLKITNKSSNALIVDTDEKGKKAYYKLSADGAKMDRIYNFDNVGRDRYLALTLYNFPGAFGRTRMVYVPNNHTNRWTVIPMNKGNNGYGSSKSFIIKGNCEMKTYDTTVEENGKHYLSGENGSANRYGKKSYLGYINNARAQNSNWAAVKCKDNKDVKGYAWEGERFGGSFLPLYDPIYDISKVSHKWVNRISALDVNTRDFGGTIAMGSNTGAFRVLANDIRLNNMAINDAVVWILFGKSRGKRCNPTSHCFSGSRCNGSSVYTDGPNTCKKKRIGGLRSSSYCTRNGYCVNPHTKVAIP